MNATRAEIVGLLREGLSNGAIGRHLHCRPSAAAAIRAELGLPNVARRHAECGTESGAQRHRKRQETVCDACQHAWNKAASDRRRITEPADTTEGETRMPINLAEFTPRERQIFHCLRRGLTAAQIAAHLGINDRIVHHHTRGLCQRLGVASRAEAARTAQAYEPAPEPAKPRGGDWRHRAACREEDPELFFPIGNTGPALLQIEEAKQVCRTCPVMEECGQWALDTRQDAGVWGAMSEDERRAVHRRRARNRARTA